MHLTPQDLEEFKTLYRQACGATLSDAEAQALAQAALALVQAVYRPLPDGPCFTEPSTLS